MNGSCIKVDQTVKWLTYKQFQINLYMFEL